MLYLIELSGIDQSCRPRVNGGHVDTVVSPRPSNSADPATNTPTWPYVTRTVTVSCLPISSISTLDTLYHINITWLSTVGVIGPLIHGEWNETVLL
jgi:hypothetical protein